jgi:hypothetical protein
MSQLSSARVLEMRSKPERVVYCAGSLQGRTLRIQGVRAFTFAACIIMHYQAQAFRFEYSVVDRADCNVPARSAVGLQCVCIHIH